MISVLFAGAAVIISDSDHVILSAVQPETIAHRFDVKDNTTIVEEEEA